MNAKEKPVVPRADFKSYYGQPILKRPTWHWYIPAYFAVGGASGVSGLIGFAARLRGLTHVARRARLTAFVGMGLSGALLIKDLGRPARFINMMRVAKVSSPMSVGTWIISAFIPAVSVGIIDDFVGLPTGIGFVADASAALLGSAVATYTAVLVSDTAIPLWSEARLELPVVFAASSTASAAGLAMLCAKGPGGPAGDSEGSRAQFRSASKALTTLAALGAVTELSSDATMRHRLGDLSRPYEEVGTARSLHRGARMFTVAGISCMIASRIQSSATREALLSRIAGTALFTGSVFERFAIFHAGIKSAEDPSYIVQLQKRHLQAKSTSSS